MSKVLDVATGAEMKGVNVYSYRSGYIVRYQHRGERHTLYVDVFRNPPIPMSSLSHAEEVARELYKRMQSPKFSPDHVAGKKSVAATFEKMYEEWIDGKLDISRSYRYALGSYLRNHLREPLGDLKVGEITEHDITKLHTAMHKKGCGAKTRKNVLDALHNFLTDHKSMLPNGLPDFPTIKLPDPEDDWLDFESQQFYFDHLPEADKPIFSAYLFSGLRAAEAVLLREADIDRDKLTVRVNKTLSRYHEKSGTKMGNKNTIPMSAMMIKHLPPPRTFGNEYLYQREGARKPDKRYSLSYINVVWRETTAKVGTHIRLHVAGRHSIASQLAEKKVHPKLIVATLRQKDIKSADRYTHTRNEAIRIALDEIQGSNVIQFRKASAVGEDDE